MEFFTGRIGHSLLALPIESKNMISREYRRDVRRFVFVDLSLASSWAHPPLRQSLRPGSMGRRHAPRSPLVITLTPARPLARLKRQPRPRRPRRIDTPTFMDSSYSAAFDRGTAGRRRLRDIELSLGYCLQLCACPYPASQPASQPAPLSSTASSFRFRPTFFRISPSLCLETLYRMSQLAQLSGVNQSGWTSRPVRPRRCCCCLHSDCSLARLLGPVPAQGTRSPLEGPSLSASAPQKETIPNP